MRSCRRSAARSPRPPAGATGRTNWPTASSASPTPRWSRRFARSPSPRAPTRASTCWSPLAGRRASTPAPWPANWAFARSSVRPTPACSAPMGSAWPTSCATAWPASTSRTPRPRWPIWKRPSSGLPARRATKLFEEGFARQQIEVRRLLDLRYRGFDSYLTIPPAWSAEQLCRSLRCRAQEVVRIRA